MGRPRQRHLELPERVYLRHGTYYFEPAGEKPVRLGRELAQALAEWARLVGRVEGQIQTLAQLFDRYMVEVAPLKAPRTYRDNLKEVIRLRPVFGHMRVVELEPHHIYSYRAARARTAPVRANREIALLSAMLSWAVELGIIQRNPCREVKRLMEVPRDRLPLDREIEIFLSVSNPMIRAYVAFKELTGLRKGDILTLRRSALTDEGILHQPRKTRRRDPRTGKVREPRRRLIEWSPELRSAVDAILALPHKVGSVYLFSTRKGQAYYNPDKARADGFDAIWKRYMKRAQAAAAALGLPFERFTEHDIRAKAGTDAEAAGQSGSKLLGNTEKQFRSAYLRGTEVVQPLKKKPPHQGG